MNHFSSASHRISLGLIFSIGLCAGWISDSSAQQFFAAQPVVLANGQDQRQMMYKNFMGQVNSKKSAAQQVIATHLEAIDRAVSLTESQQKKLSLAAKGAVKSHMAKESQKIVKMAKQSGFDFVPGTPPEEAERADGDGVEIIARGAVFRNVANGFDQSAPSTVDQEKIWVSSVKKSLTPEQAEKLNAWKSQRQAFIQQTAVEHFVAQVDAELLLSGEQREKLMSWVNEHHGPALAKRLTPQRQAFNRVFIGGGVQGIRMQNNGKPKVDPEVAAILSETQVATWTTRFQNQLGNPGAGLAPFLQIQANMIEVKIDN